jgi:hypothetical protein
MEYSPSYLLTMLGIRCTGTRTSYEKEKVSQGRKAGSR